MEAMGAAGEGKKQYFAEGAAAKSGGTGSSSSVEHWAAQTPTPPDNIQGNYVPTTGTEAC